MQQNKFTRSFDKTMMYWGLFVFAVLTASGLVKTNDDDFQCPVCRARGADPRAECDRNVVFESCNRPNPICESTFYSFGTFARRCSDALEYDRSLGYCKDLNNCKKVMCNESKCFAEFPLECPYCESYKSLEHCDLNRKTRECRQSETMCYVRKQEYGSTDNFMRGCIDKEAADAVALACTEGLLKGTCKLGTCQEPGCLASFEN